MQIIQQYATKNRCYQAGAGLTVKGIMLHSIGVPQPSAKAMANAYNQYKPNGASVCVHAFLDADGNVYQTLPWNYKAWHCGDSANSTHIGVEMTEPSTIKYVGGATWKETSDGANTKAHVMGTYKTAVELFARLCKDFSLDPLKDGVIISHSEGYRRGVASNHGDVEHIWSKFGLTMDGFRNDVAKAMNAETEQEDEDMATRYSTIDDVPEWAREKIQGLIDAGALAGKGNGVLDLSEDMLRCLIISKAYADGTRYKTIDDVPDWARDDVQALIDKGYIAGYGDGTLDLSLDMVRMLVICARMLGVV